MATLAQYRRPLAYALNDLGLYEVSSATNSTVTIVTLADSTTSASANRYDGRWVYLATGAGQGTQRRVKPGGFTPASGVLDLQLTWTVPSAGDQVEITGLFPAQTGGLGSTSVSPEDASYQTFINRALAQILVPDRITLAITTAETYPITTWPWLDRPERLLRVLEPPPNGTAAVDAMWRKPRLILGSAPQLQLNAPFATATGNLTLEVLRPAITLISGVEGVVGLATEGQTALATVEDVREIGLLEAYRDLQHRAPGRPGGAWDKKFADQQARVENLFYFDQTAWRRQQQAPPDQAAPQSLPPPQRAA